MYWLMGPETTNFPLFFGMSLKLNYNYMYTPCFYSRTAVHDAVISHERFVWKEEKKYTRVE